MIGVHVGVEPFLFLSLSLYLGAHFFKFPPFQSPFCWLALLLEVLQSGPMCFCFLARERKSNMRSIWSYIWNFIRVILFRFLVNFLSILLYILNFIIGRHTWTFYHTHTKKGWLNTCTRTYQGKHTPEGEKSKRIKRWEGEKGEKGARVLRK